MTAFSVASFCGLTARAAQPLRPQVARCIPKTPASDPATSGAGNVSATRRVDVEFRWALADPLEQAQDEIQATTRVELCWTSQSQGGIARCPGQQGDDAWIIYRASPAKGSLPLASEVQDPAQSLSSEGVRFTTPLDWDKLADRNKILFVVVNKTVQDGASLLTATNANLTAGLATVLRRRRSIARLLSTDRVRSKRVVRSDLARASPCPGAEPRARPACADP